MPHEFRLAWRGLKRRGWRGVLAVLLLSAAMAVTVAVFSAADAFILHPLPYPEPDRLVQLRTWYESARFGRSTGGVPVDLVDEWARQDDLFETIGNLAISGAQYTYGPSRHSYASRTTPGLFRLLRVPPIAGRLFVEADADTGAPPVILIRESLARDRFGDPVSAVGQSLETSAGDLTVVGVMPESFRFPDGRTRLWQPLNLDDLIAQQSDVSSYSVTTFARLRDGVPLELAHAHVLERQEAIKAGWTRRMPPGDFELVPMPFPVSYRVQESDVLSRQALMTAVLAAAICLLLTACANVASLELAGAISRARAHAIQLALGAPRRRLLRQTALEGALLVGTALAVAALLSGVFVRLIETRVPDSLTFATMNRIDLDPRALLFMAAAAVVTWAIATMPVVVLTGRANLLDVLHLEGRAASGSRLGAWLRRVLTMGEVALATALLIGAILSAASYRNLLNIDKGFDATNLASLEVRAPQARYSTPFALQELADRLVQRLERHPDVVRASSVESMLPAFAGSSSGRIFTEAGELGVATRYSYSVAPGFFDTIGLRLLEGREPTPGESDYHVVVSEAFARRWWPAESAIGKHFGTSETLRYEVIGVVPSVTHSRNPERGAADEFEVYPPRSYTAAEPGPVRTTGYRTITVVARLTTSSIPAGLRAAIVAEDPELVLYPSMVDDNYAVLFEDRMAAASIMSGFGGLAFVVAMAGVYGVMAFLVADRRREIGIRIALGADARRVGGLVVGSSVRLVVVGAALGLGGTWLASRWLESRLFGVSATDPIVYGGVASAVLLTAIVAVLPQALAASRVDPAVTLRSE